MARKSYVMERMLESRKNDEPLDMMLILGEDAEDDNNNSVNLDLEHYMSKTNTRLSQIQDRMCAIYAEAEGGHCAMQ